jgi:nucleotide-binding universal stress UspA family protein
VIVPLETWSEAVGVFESDKRLMEEAEAAGAFLNRLERGLKGDQIRVRTRVVFGKAAQSIQETAADEGASMIAMTTHGRSGLPRLVLGSVADEVVRTAIRPVLLVHASERPVTDVNIRRILVPVDGSALSESILPVVEDLAKTHGAELVLQQVITPPVFLYPGQVVPSALPALDDIESAVKDSIEVLAEALRKKGFTIKSEVFVGYPADSILAAAAQHKVDMIAMSSHGRTGVGRLVLGSVTDSVVRSAYLPCLVIRPSTIAKDQPAQDSPSVVEVAAGITAAKTIVPPPALAESRLDPPPADQVSPVRPHRPERRALN